MRLITGQLRPDLGLIQVAGHDVWTAAAKRHIGYCPEVDAFYEEMSGPAVRRGDGAAVRLLRHARHAGAPRRCSISSAWPAAPSASCAGYSKGMRQRIKLAQALLDDPELLVLDEPLSGIDPVGRAEFVALFRELAGRGKCLLISSHELDELEKLTEHVAIMARGRIAVIGTIAEIRERLDDHPLTICIEIDPVDAGGPRGLAAALLQLPGVVAVEMAESLDDAGRLLVRARQPRQFFQQFGRLVLERNQIIRRLETMDESTEAVLGYLLGGRA